MAIENFEEVQTYLEQNKESDDVKNYVGGLTLTPNRISSFLETDDGKKIIQPKLDSYVSKAISTHDEKFKANELPKLVDERYKKLYPDADPRDSKIAELEVKFEAAQKESNRKDLKNKALKIAQDSKLPTDLVDYFVADDEETTKANLQKLVDIFSKHDEQIKLEFAKSNSHIPPNSKNDTDLGDTTKLKEQIHNLMNK